MAFTSPISTNLRLVEALGLDADTTRAFTLRCEAGQMPVLTVEQFVTGEEVDDLVTVLKTFTLYEQIDEATA